MKGSYTGLNEKASFDLEIQVNLPPKGKAWDECEKNFMFSTFSFGYKLNLL